MLLKFISGTPYIDTHPCPIFSDSVIWQQTPATHRTRLHARMCVYDCIMATGLSNEGSTSVGACYFSARRRDFIPGDFSPAPGRRKPLRREVLYYFSFHDAPRYACVHAKRRIGQWRRQTMRIMRMGNRHYLISRIARISADSVTITMIDCTRMKCHIRVITTLSTTLLQRP